MMNLAGVDLNLMVVFDAIMTERHVSRAGDRIGLSQPAVSAALNRLRHLLKDDLFIRRGGSMVPTRRAQELAVPIQQALVQIQAALETEAFDPATAARTFRIASNDFAASMLLPPLAERLSTEAPQIDLRVIQADAGLGLQLVAEDAVDLAIAPFELPHSQFCQQPLFAPAGFLCAMRQGHPLAQQPLTLEAFVAAPQLLISQTGDAAGFVDAILAELGLKRRVAFSVPSFLLAPVVLAQTDYIAILPERLVTLSQKRFELYACEPPFAQRKFGLDLLWHQRLNQEPGLAWLRSLLSEIATQIETSS